MKITNDFFKETNYRDLKDCVLSDNQLEFINRLNFEKYGSGWDFIGALSFCCGNFNGALEQCLYSFVSEPSSTDFDFIRLIEEYGFSTDQIELIKKDIKQENSKFVIAGRSFLVLIFLSALIWFFILKLVFGF